MRVLDLKPSVFALLAVASCSDPVEAPPKAAFRATVSPNLMVKVGEACEQFGTADFGLPPPTSASAEGIPVQDGKDGASVGCSIKGSGSYTISASGSANGSAFAIAGTVGADGTGTLTLTLDSSATQRLDSAQPCTIDASADPGEKLRISPGEMFAKVNCPLLEDANQRPTTQCAAYGILILLQSCSK